ncbi:hypothetical protein B0H16DRAFT_1840063, partial [Mycena metata]
VGCARLAFFLARCIRENSKPKPSPVARRPPPAARHPRLILVTAAGHRRRFRFAYCAATTARPPLARTAGSAVDIPFASHSRVVHPITFPARRRNTRPLRRLVHGRHARLCLRLAYVDARSSGGGTGGGTQRERCFPAPCSTPPPSLPVRCRCLPRPSAVDLYAFSHAFSHPNPTPGADSYCARARAVGDSTHGCASRSARSPNLNLKAAHFLYAPIHCAHTLPSSSDPCRLFPTPFLDPNHTLPFASRLHARFPLCLSSFSSVVSRGGVMVSWPLRFRFRQTRARSMLHVRPRWDLRLARPRLPRRRQPHLDSGVSSNAAYRVGRKQGREGDAKVPRSHHRLLGGAGAAAGLVRWNGK